MLNYVMYEVKCTKYYLPLIYVDLRALELVCDRVNTITILMMHPRINMDMISSQFRFYFTDENNDRYGQVHSQCMIVYHMNEPSKIDKLPCLLYLEGMRVRAILIFLPYPETDVMKELCYHKHRRRKGCCPICFEERSLVNLHNDDFFHEVCFPCLFKIHQCPLCRLALG